MTIACQTVAVAAPGTISGTVTDEGTATTILGATVTLKQGDTTLATATTNIWGTYSFTGLTAGTYEVDVSATGYVTYTNISVSVTAGTTTTLNVPMYTVTNITAQTMTVTPLSCVAPCNVTVTVTWKNVGETAGSFVPNLTIDGVAVTPAPFPSENVNAGATTTHSFSVTNLSAANHSICPTPN
jgi:hypothetical protein